MPSHGLTVPSRKSEESVVAPLKGNCQETDESNYEKCPEASCDETGAITSDEFGHQGSPLRRTKRSEGRSVPTPDKSGLSGTVGAQGVKNTPGGIAARRLPPVEVHASGGAILR
jgi:hypothetical protein